MQPLPLLLAFSLSAPLGARLSDAPVPPRVPGTPAARVRAQVHSNEGERNSSPIHADEFAARSERFAEHEPAGHTILPNGVSVSAAARDHVFYDVDGEGAHWVRGRNYKARFDGEGMKFLPFLGSAAPRSFPVQLALQHATIGGNPVELVPANPAVRDGNRISIDRGPIDEIYAVEFDGVEQTFVVEQRPPTTGDLVLFVSVQSEFPRREVADGFELTNELGGMRYGRASIRRADGALEALPTRQTSAGIEIEVPAAVLAAAQYPLVVDPWVATITLGESWLDDIAPDIAYDASTDLFLLTTAEVFSGGDIDVRFDQYTSSGTFVRSSYVDFSNTDWARPKVANLSAANQFLVVSSVRLPGSTSRSIRGRIVQSSTGSVGSLITISEPAAGDAVEADVGGEPHGWLPAYYCVVWTHRFGPSDYHVYGRVVANDGSMPSSTTPIADAAGTLASHPSIAKNNGGSYTWPIVFSREMSATNFDTWGAEMRYDGVLTLPAFPISIHPAHDTNPTVSSPLGNGNYVVAWEADFGTQHDIWGVLMDGSSVLDSQNLIQMASAPVSEDQISPSLDSDSSTVVLAYSESHGGSTTDHDVYMAQYATVGGVLVTRSGPLATAGWDHDEVLPEVCSRVPSDGSRGRFAVAWQDRIPSQFQRDVYAIIYDFPVGGEVANYCFGDGSGTACPCGPGAVGRGCPNSFNPQGALLSTTGTAVVLGDSLVLRAEGMPTSNASCWFWQGTASTSIVFGDGLRCAVGTVIRMRSKFTSAGAANFPEAGEPDISFAGQVPAAGATRYYQVSYRNSVSFCTPATFNLTNGVRVTWLPF